MPSIYTTAVGSISEVACDEQSQGIVPLSELEPQARGVQKQSSFLSPMNPMYHSTRMYVKFKDALESYYNPVKEELSANRRMHSQIPRVAAKITIEILRNERRITEFYKNQLWNRGVQEIDGMVARMQSLLQWVKRRISAQKDQRQVLVQQQSAQDNALDNYYYRELQLEDEYYRRKGHYRKKLVRTKNPIRTITHRLAPLPLPAVLHYIPWHLIYRNCRKRRRVKKIRKANFRYLNYLCREYNYHLYLFYHLGKIRYHQRRTRRRMQILKKWRLDYGYFSIRRRHRFDKGGEGGECGDKPH